MVELVEVEDESFEKQSSALENDEEEYTDTDSEISTDDEDNLSEDETLIDRVTALRDIIPATTRSYISRKVDTTSGWISSGLLLSAKALFVMGTSALFLGVPWALAFQEEQQVMEMEKEMKMREMGGELLTPSSASAGALNAQLGAPQEDKPAL